jgi:acyl transferase domain-containing protein
MTSADRLPSTAVAVVGMAGRFPGANSVAAYWDLLTGNVDAVTEIPPDRFDVDAYHSPEPGTPGRTVSRFGGFLDGVREFDAAFFGISPREARAMDPQQRLLLATTWEALEDAGIPPSRLQGSRGGVFVGQATADYARLQQADADRDVRSVAGADLRAVTAGRLSYALDLRGPSVVIDTACSSSLVAVHTARQSLLTGECDLAIAAGVNVILSPHDAIAYSQSGMLAPDGRCKFGDAGADGFVRSEGAAVVVLKRLADALADGDPVRAVLLGSATGNDGASGLRLQPAVDGQVQLLRAVYADIGVDPATVDYVEAHGTGTRVGDQVELAALAEVLGAGRPTGRPCLVGSAKSNIGHTEAAAGLAGLIKAVLIAEHGLVPASLHVKTLAAGLVDGALRVVTGNRTLPGHGRHPVLGVSSFGISGTNAHVVLTRHEPAAPTLARPKRRPAVLTVSARSAGALAAGAAGLHAHLTGPGAGLEPADAGYTTAVRRDHHEYRLAVVGQSTAELADGLAGYLAGKADPMVATGDAGTGERPPVVFVFPGQGGQWTGMGRELYRDSPAFRAALDECDAAVRAEAGWSVVEALHDAAASEAVDVVQPVLWAMQVAIAAHWASLGVTPDTVVGHSMGEVAAAQVAGALSVRDAAAVICRRSALMRTTAGTGSMLWTRLPAAEAAGLVAGRPGPVCVAADNSPTTSVLSGDTAAVHAIAAQLAAREIDCQPVRVDVASHSPLVADASRRLRDRLTDLTPAATPVTFQSTVYGRPMSGAALDADYWADNLRLPVRLTDALRAVLAERDSVVVEVGPHPVLLGAIREIQDATSGRHTAVASLVREQPEPLSLAAAAARVHAAGGAVDWAAWYAGGGELVRLPGYRWDREEYWHEPVAADSTLVRDVALDPRTRDALGGLGFRGVTPVPGAALLDAVLSVAGQTLAGESFALHDVRFHRMQASDPEPALRVTLRGTGGGQREFTMHAVLPGDEPVLCAEGRLRVDAGEAAGWDGALGLDEALARCPAYVSAAEFGRLAAGAGYRLEGEFGALRQAWRGADAAVARFVPDGPAHPPVAWESALQTVLLALPRVGSPVPVGIDEMSVGAAPAGEFWAVGVVRRGEPVVDVTLHDERQEVIGVLRGVRVLDGAARRGRRAPLAAVVRRFGSRTRPGEHQHAEPPAPVAAPAPAAAANPPVAPAGRDEVLAEAAAVLGTSSRRLDPRRRLRDLGLDSMMAAELAARLRRTTGLRVAADSLLGPASIGELADRLAG